MLVLGLARSGKAAVAALERRGVEVAAADRELGNDTDLSLLRSQNVRQSGVNAGIGQTFGTGKAVVVTAAAVVTAVVAVLGALHLI